MKNKIIISLFFLLLMAGNSMAQNLKHIIIGENVYIYGLPMISFELSYSTDNKNYTKIPVNELKTNNDKSAFIWKYNIANSDLASLKFKIAGNYISYFTDNRDEKVYKIIIIGNQTWMAENLAYKTNSGCWAYDDNSSNVAKYGYLYNFETAKSVCPDGYHLPTDDEWKELEMHLGMTQTDANNNGYRGTIGYQLKSETGWSSYGNGSNESGFNAFSGGYRFTGGSFNGVGDYGGWWSSTSLGSSTAWCRKLYYYGAGVGRDNDGRVYGFSVRCCRN